MEEALGAPTKETAKNSLRKLEFQASVLGEKLSPYASGKPREVISFCKAGSGQVKDKDHWINCAQGSWHVFMRASRESSTES